MLYSSLYFFVFSFSCFCLTCFTQFHKEQKKKEQTFQKNFNEIKLKLKTRKVKKSIKLNEKKSFIFYFRWVHTKGCVCVSLSLSMLFIFCSTQHYKCVCFAISYVRVCFVLGMVKWMRTWCSFGKDGKTARLLFVCVLFPLWFGDFQFCAFKQLFHQSAF